MAMSSRTHPIWLPASAPTRQVFAHHAIRIMFFQLTFLLTVFVSKKSPLLDILFAFHDLAAFVCLLGGFSLDLNPTVTGSCCADALRRTPQVTSICSRYFPGAEKSAGLIGGSQAVYLKQAAVGYHRVGQWHPLVERKRQVGGGVDLNAGGPVRCHQTAIRVREEEWQ